MAKVAVHDATRLRKGPKYAGVLSARVTLPVKSTKSERSATRRSVGRASSSCESGAPGVRCSRVTTVSSKASSGLHSSSGYVSIT